MRWREAFIVVCLALNAAGCSSYAWQMRYGIDPILDPAAVEVASNNHVRILTALARDANLFPSTPGDWYPVAEAGFNYIDDQCRLYFNRLFFLNRERDQLKSGILATAATTAAILGVTGASTTSMTVVAQAFGLGAAATDLIAGTYLYNLPPATTQGFVKEMQLAYREGAALKRTEINPPTAAYHVIQSYLALCLPPTIEAKIGEHIATTRAFPDLPRAGALIGVTLANPRPMTRASIRQAVGVASPAHATPPTSSGGTVVRIPASEFGPDQVTKILRDWLSPDGVLDTARRQTVRDFIARVKPGLLISTFLDGKEYAALRVQLARE